MTPTDAATLLTMASAFDGRKPDEHAARAWAAVLEGLRIEDCRAAVIEHYQTSRDWMMPADIRSAVRKARAKRLEEWVRRNGPIMPPPMDSNEAEIAFVVEAKRRIADGEQVDPPSRTGEPIAGRHVDYAELTRRVPDDERPNPAALAKAAAAAARAALCTHHQDPETCRKCRDVAALAAGEEAS